MGQQRYTDEFRREAVRQVIEKGHAVKDVAERLGVSSWSLYEWLRKARAGSGPGGFFRASFTRIRSHKHLAYGHLW